MFNAVKSMKRKSIKFARMTIHEANQQLLSGLSSLYDSREAANITDLVMENITGWKKIDRVMNKGVQLSPEKTEVLESHITGLLASKPVQYVLGEAWFYGMRFFVNEHVLIPRPETEELVKWVIDSFQVQKDHQPAKESSILDVGTGSGCIATALKKNLSAAQVYACDISNEALGVAKKNASDHHTPVSFIQLDFTNRNDWSKLPPTDIIVSNPPYIPLNGKDLMDKNVVNYEPHLALFVEDHQPLLFYEAIAGFAALKLLPGGSVFAETHEELAGNVAELFASKGYRHVTIRKDMHGKERMIHAADIQ